MMKQRYVRQTGLLCATLTTSAWAAPVQQSWDVGGDDDTVATACARLAGWYAVADSFEDNVEVYDIHKQLIHVVTKTDIRALLEGFGLGGGPDGPCGLAWSDSGRWLFILVYEELNSPDDAILRYDTFLDQLTVFARLDLFDHGGMMPFLSAVHFRGHLYAGTYLGGIKVYQAGANDVDGKLSYEVELPAGTYVRGLAIDHDANFLYAASESAVYRADLSQEPLQTDDFVEIGAIGGIRAIAYSDHYGGSGNEGMYILDSNTQLQHVPPAQAHGEEPFAPTVYVIGKTAWYDVAASADGGLLVGQDEDAVLISDDTDTGRLSYSDWLLDEFGQVVSFGKSLVLPDDDLLPCCPDGSPAGWVIDADVQETWCRFHPATPDGAAWVTLLVMMNEHINGDLKAKEMVNLILERYAGLAADAIAPESSVDGHFRHWMDPATGELRCPLPKCGEDPDDKCWPDEFAVLSTMKMVVAAARAIDAYDDPVDPVEVSIRQSATEIIWRIQNWDAYLQSGVCDNADDGMCSLALVALPTGGPDPASFTDPFFEGIIFVEQAATYGGAPSKECFCQWLNRPLWPTAEYVTDKPVTGNVADEFLPAFVSLYPFLLQEPYRNSPDWRDHVDNLRCSSAAWTDDHGPRYYTVFSAGTTKPEWADDPDSGYHADSLSDHPGDITTFPSLMAFCATGQTAEAVAAYHAYRHDARQTFAGGASILYRRSDEDPLYQPNSAGLPDVALGALGLAELLQPGSIDSLLAIPYPVLCEGDANGDGLVDPLDSGYVLARFGCKVGPGNSDCKRADQNHDGLVDPLDVGFILARFGPCP